jgi:hypothetical protein
MLNWGEIATAASGSSRPEKSRAPYPPMLEPYVTVLACHDIARRQAASAPTISADWNQLFPAVTTWAAGMPRFRKNDCPKPGSVSRGAFRQLAKVTNSVSQAISPGAT